jgi:hypothetical protein
LVERIAYRVVEGSQELLGSVLQAAIRLAADGAGTLRLSRANDATTTDSSGRFGSLAAGVAEEESLIVLLGVGDEVVETGVVAHMLT